MTRRRNYESENHCRSSHQTSAILHRATSKTLGRSHFVRRSWTYGASWSTNRSSKGFGLSVGHYFCMKRLSNGWSNVKNLVAMYLLSRHSRRYPVPLTLPVLPDPSPLSSLLRPGDSGSSVRRPLVDLLLERKEGVERCLDPGTHSVRH